MSKTMTECTHEDCTNEAKWYPYLMMRSDDLPEMEPLRSLSPMPHCDKCKEILKLEDFMTDNYMENINKSILEYLGKLQVGLINSELTWIDIATGEAVMNTHTCADRKLS